MRLPTTRPALGALAVAATLALAACGTSGGNDAADTTTTKAKTTTTKATTTTADTAAAQERADSVDLTTSDFPDGWTSTPASTTEDSAGGIDQCDPAWSDDSTTLAKHATDDFSVGSFDSLDGTKVSAVTRVYATEADAEAVIEPFSKSSTIDCISKGVKDSFEENGQITATGEMTEDDPGDLGTDDAQGVSGTYQLTATDGTKVNATVALLVMRTGDLATSMLIMSLGDNLDPTDLQGPVKAIAEAQAAA